nr:MAG TPA: hypothetical protein [Caudoviricetes sp.]
MFLSLHKQKGGRRSSRPLVRNWTIHGQRENSLNRQFFNPRPEGRHLKEHSEYLLFPHFLKPSKVFFAHAAFSSCTTKHCLVN